jgi:radical SAM protein with 4Fe4S-binding SPASM domain
MEYPSMHPIGHIDEPTDLEKVGKYIRVKGWVITSDTNRADLYVDNKFLGQIEPFIKREDVKREYPDLELSAPTGFDQIFEMPMLSPGTHTIFLEFKAVKSIKTRFSRQIKKLPPYSHKFFTRLVGNRYRAHQIRFNDSYDHILKTLGIETSRVCNFHCDMCPAHSERGRFPKESLVADDRLIDRVIPFLKGYHHKISRIDAGSVWGEPLMNAGFFSNTDRIIQAYPEAYVDLTTNGSFLTPENIERLLDIKNLRQITVSIDAGTKQTYERIRKGGRWDSLIDNISSLMESKKSRSQAYPIISTNFVAMKDNFQELPKYVRKMADIGVDVISVVNVHNCYSSDAKQGIFDLPTRKSDDSEEREKIIEEVQNIDLPEKTSLHLPSFSLNKKSAECSLCAASTMIIGIEGNVYPCCILQSLNYEGNPEAISMGNIFEKDLASIWNSKQFLDFRLNMLRGLLPNRICSNCPFFYGM